MTINIKLAIIIDYNNNITDITVILIRFIVGHSPTVLYFEKIKYVLHHKIWRYYVAVLILH